MTFIVYIKDDIGNQISKVTGQPLKILSFDELSWDITGNFLIKGDYRLPREHILFIKEV
jgi:hypothetical protein